MSDPYSKSTEITRRDFGKITGLFAILSSAVFAQEDCTLSTDIKDNEEAILLSDWQLRYWMSGNFFESDFNLTLHLDFSLIANDEYIRKIVLTDSGKNTIAARYITSNTSRSYFFFDQISVNERLDIMVLTQQKETTKIYRYTWTSDKLQAPKVSDLRLPTKINNEIKALKDQVISNHMHYARSQIIDLHCQQFPPADTTKKITCQRIVHISWDLLARDTNNNFTLKVFFSQTELNPTSYLRYFILTDPVGRILAVSKRNHEGKENFILLQNISAKDRKSLGLTSAAPAMINECPYVLLFVEYSDTMLSQTTISLR
jgi:hypothetical protein